MKIKLKHLIRPALGVLAIGLCLPAATAKDSKILNVSYDPTRELYQEINAAFAKQWQAKTGDNDHDPAVPWRVGQTGALCHRRPGG